MAWGVGDLLGSVQSKAANQASLVLTTTATAEAGNVVVLAIAVDNNVTGDVEPLDTQEVTGVTDSAGNTYTKAKAWVNGQAAAQTGASVSIWFSKLTSQLNSGGTITATFDATASRDAAAMLAIEFTIGAGNVVSVEGSATQSDDAVDPSALTISGLTNQEYLWFHALAAEGPNSDTYSFDPDYSLNNGNGTTGGGAQTNMHIRAEYRIFTGTTDTVDMTSNTADRDYAQAYVALKEAGAPPPGAHKGLSLLGVGH